jgi:hypothetical protein
LPVRAAGEGQKWHKPALSGGSAPFRGFGLYLAEVSNLGASPVLARWLAVLRMRQVAEAKSRV